MKLPSISLLTLQNAQQPQDIFAFIESVLQVLCDIDFLHVTFLYQSISYLIITKKKRLNLYNL